MHSLRHDHVVAAVPSSLIDDQNDSFGRADAKGGSKFRQDQRPNRDGDPRQHKPEGLPALRTHKAIEVSPCVAMLDRDQRALSFLAPDPPKDRFESDSMFILAPDFHRRVGILGLELCDSLRQRFF